MNNKRKIAIIVLVILTFSFYFLYNNTTVYWDAYAYEVSLTDNPEPENTIPLTSEELVDYPKVVSALEEAKREEWTMVTPEDGDSLFEFTDFLESKNEEMERGYVYLQWEKDTYAVYFTSYGGIDDQPIYLLLTGLAGLAALGLTSVEIYDYIRMRN